jgi:porphobilinogen synthase
MSIGAGTPPIVSTPTVPGRARPRRLRRTAALRALVRETRPPRDALVMPHFVLPQAKGIEPVPSMPGIARYGVDDLRPRVEKDLALGIRAVLLFGICPEEAKDARGSEAWSAGAAVPRAVRALKQAFGGDLVVMTDVCLCAYTDHGHCGILEEGRVRNDPSLAPLASEALCHAEAGADLVAPSDMMDGRVAAIRDALDERGHEEVGILAYSVKYASAYYGPFRDAAHSAPGQGDRKSYQMDPANAREAIREALLDAEEGADLLMVKPALAYLDVIRAVAEVSDRPLAAYNVSGEYAQVKAAAERGWIDEAGVVRENLTGMFRAGADVVITYHAREALEKGWLA